MAARWAADNGEAIRDLDPEMPKGVINRAADNWRPLAAIAVAARGRWPARVSKAATKAQAATAVGDDTSEMEMVLADIRDTFDTDKAMTVLDLFGVPQIAITSAKLVKALITQTAARGPRWARPASR